MSIEEEYQPLGTHATVLQWRRLALMVVWSGGEMCTGEENFQDKGREGGYKYLDSSPRRIHK